MAQNRSQVWLTTVFEDEDVESALVLAESLRKTRTTRSTAVLTSSQVSSTKRAALRKSFDAVFFMANDSIPEKCCQASKDVQAIIFAFSMIFFEKCVFLPPNAMVLENIDKIFDDEMEFKTRFKVLSDTTSSRLFMISPKRNLWKRLIACIRTLNNGMVPSEEYVCEWLTTQNVKLEALSEDPIESLSLKTELLLTKIPPKPIIKFVGTDMGKGLAGQLKLLQDQQLGLTEKLITKAWLDIYENVKRRINDLENIDFPLNEESCGYINEPIAIIGMSCRYPGANNLNEFWNMLYDGKEGIREPPAFRWTKEHSLRVSQNDRKTHAGFLASSVDEFDAKFFGVSPKEAMFIDPQARLLHEVIWESLEDGGIDPSSLYGTHTGIFTGSWMNDYKDIVEKSTDYEFFRTYMGNSMGAVAARLSFFLGLTGPSIATESGCSSAIVAVDLAVKSLRSGETSLALAAGVNLLLHPFTTDMMNYIISSNGRCKTFDAKADGFGRAEGCGVLVLKRMCDALSDRDNIWGIIRGSAVSQEGLSRSMGTPTIHCEALAMKLALKDANIKPEQVSFVETHGTGTAVGDPMEIAAISKAYYSADRKEPLIIGSVKTNVGHTESCSGITGIMKTVLAMQNQLIPKHLNLDELNPEIFLDSIPAVISLQPMEWRKVQGKPRYAGVSSFGITGTDGHVILEEAPDYQYPKFCLGMERPVHIMKICGKTDEALQELLSKYKNQFYEKAKILEGQNDFANTAYSSNVGRAGFNHRAVIVASNYKQAGMILKENNYLRGEIKETEKTSNQICFLFTGQGCQYEGMAKLLYDTSPIFHTHFDSCEKMLKRLYNLSIRDVLWESDFPDEKISRTIYSQTSIFCVEYCLFKLWQSWGIEPNYVLGHSLGEFAAAVAANILTFQDALKLVAERSRLIDSLPRGSMLVVMACKSTVGKLLTLANCDLDFAAVNHPEQTVLAGNTTEVQKFLDYLNGKEIKAVLLEATHAFHSRHMDPILERYKAICETIVFQKGNNVQYISGLEGKLISDPSEINSDYWIRHTREKVSFIDASDVVNLANVSHYLEIGPQPVLSTFIMLNNQNKDTLKTCLASLRRGTNDWETILSTLGKLYLTGFNVDWEGLDKPYIRNKVALPFHPFNRKPFWVDCNKKLSLALHPLLGVKLSNASNLSIFENNITTNHIPYLKDHCIGNRIIFPGAAFAEMCLSAGYCVANGFVEQLDVPRRAIKLENLQIETPFEFKEGKNCCLQVIVDLPNETDNIPTEGHGFLVKIFHQDKSLEDSTKWVLHATSTFLPMASTKQTLRHFSPEKIQTILSSVEPTDPQVFYKRAEDSGLKFGPKFKQIERHWNLPSVENNTDEVVAKISIPEDHDKYLLHPLIIDAAIQASILTKVNYNHASKLKVPIRLGSLTLLSNVDRTSDTSLYLHAWSINEKLQCFIFSNLNTFIPIAFIEDIEIIDTTIKTVESVLEQQTSSFPEAWEECWRVIPGPYTDRLELIPIQRLFSQDEFKNELGILCKTNPNNLEMILKTNRLIYLYILKALYDLGWQPTLHDENINIVRFCDKFRIAPEFRKLVRFYFTVFQEEHIFEHDSSTNTWKILALPPSHNDIILEADKLTKELKYTKSDLAVKIYDRISQSLPVLLTGQESVLDILFPTKPENEQFSAHNFYLNYPGREDSYKVVMLIVRKLLEMQHFANKSDSKRVLRILEVGAGTGSLSRVVLEILREIWGTQFEYYYTDISLGFFTTAEKTFEEYKVNIKFVVFNVEQGPIEQGIPLEYFDLVVATDVLHATRNLQETLIHIRQIMRPRAALYFTESIECLRDCTFVFGLLDGYWRFEDFERRPHHCCTNQDGWRDVLSYSGFTSFNYCEPYEGRVGCITAEADENTDILNLNDFPTDRVQNWVVFSTVHDKVTEYVANLMYAAGFNVSMVFKCEEKTNELENARKLINPSISLTCINSKNIAGNSIENILSTKKAHGIYYGWGIIQDCIIDQDEVSLPFLHIAQWSIEQSTMPKLFIFTKGVHSINGSLTCNPTSATLFGMVKSLKNENPEMIVRYIDLEPDDEKENCRKNVTQILFELAIWKGSKEASRLQVAYRDNQRLEPRLIKTHISKAAAEELKLPPSVTRYQLVLPKSRAIKDLEFDNLEVADIEENQVEIKVKAYALNFKDVLSILKPSAEFESFNLIGHDFSGYVSKLGSNVNTLKVGDKVFGANYKDMQLPSHVIIAADRLHLVGTNMTCWEASTLQIVYATAYYSLFTIAKMKKGETILIHTGSGGVGLAAIEICKPVGVTIITTAGNPRKRAYLKSLGIEHVFNSRSTSYEHEILQVTKEKGVDIVLNSITGPGFKEASLSCCTKNARFVEMSKLNIWTNEQVKALRPDVQYSIVDLRHLDNEEWMQLAGQVKEYIDQGHCKPIPYVKFDALNIRQAMHYFQRAKHIGKIVCVMPEIDIQNGVYKVTVPLFNNQSTYLITGGLKGIGFEVCKWMLEKGATDIVLMSRNPPSSNILQDIKDLNSEGFNILIRLGDVSNLNQCKAIIEEIAEEGKPLRGIMHCAGVLSDNLYVDQTWQSFKDTFKPKVTGTWNLHNLTEKLDLEHFVLFSSFSALLGMPSQSNHAAANCFEDAFAHFRHSKGLSATSINWGVWSQVGIASDMNVPGALPVSVKRMLNGLQFSLKHPNQQQLAFGSFDSFSKSSIFCPMIKHYADDRLLETVVDNSKTDDVLNTNKFWAKINIASSKPEMESVVQYYLKAILRAALRLDTDDDINKDANLTDIGVDSLMAIELKNSIQTLLGSKVTVTPSLLKNSNTVTELAASIVEKIVQNDNTERLNVPLTRSELLELFDTDIKLDQDIRPEISLKLSVKPSQVKTVLVTGATGQIGCNIIAEVSKNYTNVNKIVCLLRPVEGSSPEQRVLNSLNSIGLTNSFDLSELEYVVGDVTEINLGMDQKTFDKLCELVDAIFYCAGSSDYTEIYRRYDNKKRTDIRSVLVVGLKNTLQFACTKKLKPIFFPSSIMCALFGGKDDDESLSDHWSEPEAIKALISSTFSGLQLSQMVCELVLKEANIRGIPCKVFRYPWIAGNSITGRLNHSSSLYIMRYLSYLKVGAMPDLALPANILPIDLCTEISVKIFFNDDSPFEIFNISHPCPQLEQEFVRVAKVEFGRDLEILEYSKFAERLDENEGNNKMLEDLYQGIKAMGLQLIEATMFWKRYIVNPDTFFQNEKVTRFVPEFYSQVEPSMETVTRDLRYLKCEGLFDKLYIT